MAKCGELVVFHDVSLERFFPSDRLLATLTMEELRQFKFANSECIPSLREVLDLCKGKMEVNIEIKGNSPEIAHAIHKQIKDLNLQDEIIVSCFHTGSLLSFRDIDQKTRVAFLLGHDTRFSWKYLNVPLICSDMKADIIHPRTNYVDEEFCTVMRESGLRIIPFASTSGEEIDDKEKVWELSLIHI